MASLVPPPHVTPMIMLYYATKGITADVIEVANQLTLNREIIWVSLTNLII